MNQIKRLRWHYTVVAMLVIIPGFSSLSVQAAEDKTAEKTEQYKSGYSTKPAFGGPNSPEGQLEEADRRR